MRRKSGEVNLKEGERGLATSERQGLSSSIKREGERERACERERKHAAALGEKEKNFILGWMIPRSNFNQLVGGEETKGQGKARRAAFGARAGVGARPSERGGRGVIFFSSTEKNARWFSSSSLSLFHLSAAVPLPIFLFSHLERDQRLSRRGAILLLCGGLCVAF